MGALIAASISTLKHHQLQAFKAVTCLVPQCLYTRFQILKKKQCNFRYKEQGIVTVFNSYIC